MKVLLEFLDIFHIDYVENTKAATKKQVLSFKN